MPASELRPDSASRPRPSEPSSPAPSRPSTRPTRPARLVTRWDLDKTYLRSDFYTWRELVSTAFERPDQKRPVPGASQLLAELGRTGSLVHILSGSPEQLRRAIVERLEMDGVRVDSITLKPNLRNLLRMRFFALKDQLGYKLPALLEARAAELRASSEPHVEILVGDDSEADPFVYSLYADIASGSVDRRQLERILDAGRLYPADKAKTLALADELGERIRQDEHHIVVHLDRQSPPSNYAKYGKRMVPVFNYAQAALYLLDQSLVTAEAASNVALDLLVAHRFDLRSLARSYWDLRRRGHVRDSLLGELSRASLPGEVAGWPAAILRDPLDAQPQATLGADAPLDYITLARAHAGGRNRA